MESPKEQRKKIIFIHILAQYTCDATASNIITPGVDLTKQLTAHVRAYLANFTAHLTNFIALTFQYYSIVYCTRRDPQTSLLSLVVSCY
jgi:hypothetical protein